MRITRRSLFAAAAVVNLLCAPAVRADLAQWLSPAHRPQAAPAPQSIEVAFSPDTGATDLVVKVIDSAKKNIRVAAYSFTSKPIAQALVAAHRRGIDVRVVVDKSQQGARYTAATFLSNMDVPTHVDRVYAIMHNKFIVVDERHLETGSFNFTAAAEHHNAENVLVVWDDPKLAGIYLQRWNKLWNESEDFQAGR